jgi:hypothetical protein
LIFVVHHYNDRGDSRISRSHALSAKTSAYSQFVGQLLYLASGRKIFTYPEERSDFELPEKYKEKKDKPSRFGEEQEREERPEGTQRHSSETVVGEGEEALSRSNDGEKKNKDGEKKEDDHISVEWYGENDPENPQNWYVPRLRPCRGGGADE